MSICEKCDKACKGCRKPVDGWQATYAPVLLQKAPGRPRRREPSWHVTYCPEWEPDARQRRRARPKRAAMGEN